MVKKDSRGRRKVGLRAVLLARVSTLKRSQDKSGPRQLAELRELAQRRGWDVVADFTDRQSGADDERPGLQAAIDLVVNRHAEILVVHELDRLGRDVPSLIRNEEKLGAAGGHLFIRDRQVDTTTPEGRLFFVQMAGLAEFQRRSNSGKVLAGLAHARKKGVRLGRPPVMEKALARACELRKLKMSWAEIANQLRTEEIGDHSRTTVATAVRRALEKKKKVKAKSPPSDRRSPDR